MIQLLRKLAAGGLAQGSIRAGGLVFGFLLSLSWASQAATVSVRCPGQSINAAIAAAFTGQGRVPSVEPLTINVSGTCTENVSTPPLRLVTLVGPATLLPASANAPALFVSGGVTVRNMAIRSSLAVDALIRVRSMDFLSVEDSTVISTAARKLLTVYGNSEVELYNSILSGGSESALELGGGAHVGVFAGSGGKTAVRSPVSGNFQAIGCYNAFLDVHADLGSSVTIGPSGYAAIDARGCKAVIGGHGSNAGTVKIIGADDVGIRLKSGDAFSLVQVSVTGHAGTAIEVSAGVMEIDATTISNNGSGLNSRRGAIIRFNNIYGPSTVGGPNRFTCYQDGKIFADTGFIAGINSSTACLTVDGPTTH